MHWGWFGAGVVSTLVVVNFPALYVYIRNMVRGWGK